MSYTRNEPRPVIKPTLTIADYVLEGTSLWLLIAICAYAWLVYNSLPETIPTHFNIHGQVDGYGSKWSVFIFPALALVLYIALSILNRFPHVFNYPVAITSENALRQYTLATRLLRIIKTSVMIVFSIILILTTRQNLPGIHSGFLIPVILILMFGPIIYYLRLAFRK